MEDTSSAIDEMFIRENIKNIELKELLNMKRLLQSSLDKINSNILKIRTVSSNNNTDQKELFEEK